VESAPREARTSRRYWIKVNNQGLRASLESRSMKASYGTPFILNGQAPAGSHVLQGNRKLVSAQTDTGDWEVILPSSLLGLGPVTLQAEVETADGYRLERVTLLGEFKIDSRGFHQLAIHTRGTIVILVDEQKFELEAPTDRYGMVYLPLFLEGGWHRLEIRPSPRGFPKLQLVLGGMRPPMTLGGKWLRTINRNQ